MPADRKFDGCGGNGGGGGGGGGRGGGGGAGGDDDDCIGPNKINIDFGRRGGVIYHQLLIN